MDSPTDAVDPLAYYRPRRVEELVEVENTRMGKESCERHQIFSLLVMSLAFDAWNGNKHGRSGTYPWRTAQQTRPGEYSGDRYLGHNIASIAVDAGGEIIDFEFNHNDIFNSSAEHAEARLVRRIFNLNQVYDHWQTTTPGDIPYANQLSAVTVYTTLESCAQCSGVMTLGNVKSVVYLQSDPGQYLIGNILYNLSNPLSISHPRTLPAPSGPSTVAAQKYGAPEPISGDLFGYRQKRELDSRYRNYVAAVKENPEQRYFWQSPDRKAVDASTSITSFLCTDEAREIFETAANELDQMQPPAHINPQLVTHAKQFRAYVAQAGHRGTPHR